MIALIADDSPTQRALWMYAFSGDDIELRILQASDVMRGKVSTGKGILDIIVARDGIEANQVSENLTPDVVITDVDMPDMNGWELAEAVQRRHPRLPVVVFSSRVTTGQAVPSGLDPERTHIVAKGDRQQAIDIVRSLLPAPR